MPRGIFAKQLKSLLLLDPGVPHFCPPRQAPHPFPIYRLISSPFQVSLRCRTTGENQSNKGALGVEFRDPNSSPDSADFCLGDLGQVTSTLQTLG